MSFALKYRNKNTFVPTENIIIGVKLTFTMGRQSGPCAAELAKLLLRTAGKNKARFAGVRCDAVDRTITDRNEAVFDVFRRTTVTIEASRLLSTPCSVTET